MLRLTPKLIADLDRLCAEYSQREGRLLHRSGLVECLIVEALADLGKRPKQPGIQAQPPGP